MTIEEWIQYGSMAFAITLLVIKRKGMKQYVPVGLFASFYANLWCYPAAAFHWWHYPSRIVPEIEISLPANFVAVPIMAMFWVRYFPLRFREQAFWAIFTTSGLTAFELLIERYTDVLEYHSGYDWYHSFVLWFFSWFIWYGFHLWLYNGRREFDSLFGRQKIRDW